MNNNFNSTNNATQSNKSNLPPFKIHYFEHLNMTSLEFSLIIREEYSGRMTVENACKALQSNAREAISALSQHVGSVSFDLLMNNSHNAIIVEENSSVFLLLASYIRSYTELMEFIEMYESREEKDSTPLDLSEVCTGYLKTQDQKSKPKTRDLAEAIAELLRRDDLPHELAEVIKDGITDLYNSKIDQTEILAFHDSPEFIEMVLRGYQEPLNA